MKKLIGIGLLAASISLLSGCGSGGEKVERENTFNSSQKSPLAKKNEIQNDENIWIHQAEDSLRSEWENVKLDGKKEEVVIDGLKVVATFSVSGKRGEATQPKKSGGLFSSSGNVADCKKQLELLDISLRIAMNEGLYSLSQPEAFHKIGLSLQESHLSTFRCPSGESYFLADFRTYEPAKDTGTEKTVAYCKTHRLCLRGIGGVVELSKDQFEAEIKTNLASDTDVSAQFEKVMAQRQ